MTKLSICTPIYNGADSFFPTFKSLINQIDQLTCSYEWIISNNASTDETQHLLDQLKTEYCSYNIRVIHQQKNLGLWQNYKFLLDQAIGKYVVFPSHDDILLESFYSDAVYILDRKSEVCLVHSHGRIRSLQTSSVIRYENSRLMGEGSTPIIRFMNTLKCYDTIADQGVIRRNTFLKTHTFHFIPGADHIFLNELSLYGYFYDLGYIGIDYSEDDNKFARRLDISKASNKSYFFRSSWIFYNSLSLVKYYRGKISPNLLVSILLVCFYQKQLILQDIIYLLKSFISYIHINFNKR